ncbi:MAG: type II toxin-antitoxin system VapC family toxin [bacterium]
MDEKFIIDTNILIYYLDGSIPNKQLTKLEKIFVDSFNISTITKIELLGWQKIDKTTISKIELFIRNAKIYYLDFHTENKTIELKQKYKIAIPDTIIAATALINKFTLVTRNQTDFRKIKNLKIYNPYEK